ncbi:MULTISPECIES: DUF3592 domain-containing protein [unclassified Streptomyces]|uniref:DUF3592 domain-containing protein n=1 Tax=Streptomyces sp. SID8380 TaxID=2690360 RepID=UPI000BAC5716|nr:MULTISPECIES: DUF3592 domain-containing protein [unclassified Streptomyces]ASY32044.1 hypothetical protein CAC01_04470 [Streptomyces sp. CLI2509]MYX19556.1 DUF3592 domain-containing protein [Streptomyces sp. SID8380]
MSFIFLVASLIPFLFAFREVRVQYRLKHHGTHARGRVVSHNTAHDAVFAIIDFTDADGTRYTFQSQSSGVGKLPLGREVPVRYEAHDPNIARIDLPGRKIVNIAIPALIGAWLLGAALFLALHHETYSGPPHGR